MASPIHHFGSPGRIELGGAKQFFPWERPDAFATTLGDFWRE